MSWKQVLVQVSVEVPIEVPVGLTLEVLVEVFLVYLQGMVDNVATLLASKLLKSIQRQGW